MMKEKIAKFIMGIFCILIVVAIRICFLRGQWINGSICIILAFFYFPPILDKITKKLALH